MQLKNFLLAGIGGMAGSMLRYLVYVLSGTPGFPYATMLVNIVGSFIIGVIAAIALKQPSFEAQRLLLATGFCGGFTTFSAFSLECIGLLQQNRNIAALIYVMVSVVLGIAAAFGGYLVITK